MRKRFRWFRNNRTVLAVFAVVVTVGLVGWPAMSDRRSDDASNPMERYSSSAGRTPAETGHITPDPV